MSANVAAFAARRARLPLGMNHLHSIVSRLRLFVASRKKETTAGSAPVGYFMKMGGRVCSLGRSQWKGQSTAQYQRRIRTTRNNFSQEPPVRPLKRPWHLAECMSTGRRARAFVVLPQLTKDHSFHPPPTGSSWQGG
jgi:hypothetical protein